MNLCATMPVCDLATAIRRQTFPAHPLFPQLTTTTDPSAMLEVFRKYLKPVAGKAFTIEQCSPVRFRWRKSGARCSFQYALQLRDSRAGNLSNVWAGAVVYAQAGQANEAFAEQRALERSRPIPEELLTFQPVDSIPELNMVVQVFPYDRYIPNLPLVLGGPWPELEIQLLERFGPGQWQITEKVVEPLRYRAEDSAVVRYSLKARDSALSRIEARRFYVKAYRTSYGQQIAEMLQQVRQQAAAGGKNFTAVEPIAYCARRRCLILAEAEGESLQQVLSRGNGAEAARQVAQALAGFHQCEISTTVCHSAEEQLRFFTQAANLMRWACPASTDLIDQIVDEVRLRLRNVPHVPIHWDLKADHVFLADGRVTFLDLDTVSLGDPARDPAHLAAHIACRIDVPDLPEDSARAAADAFVEEYFKHVPTPWRQQFALQYGIAALEAGCGLFKRQEPGWRERARAAIQEGLRGLTTVDG